MTRTARRRHAGFTLLEVQVTLVAFGLLLALLAAALRFGTGTGADRLARTGAVPDAVPVESLLRTLLTDARLEAGRESFAGTADRVRFIAPLPSAANTDTATMLTLDRRDGVLRLRWQAAPGGNTSLLPGVAALRLRYFGAAAREDAPRWRDNWTDATHLPRLVELVARSPSGETLLALRVAPRVTAAP
jgi:prepilin-type N-terminal cleavage/methylation domain-containing protein